MDLFGESEVVFPGTFRKNAPVGRTLSIKSYAIVNPSGSVDPQELAGSFGFPEDSGLENRFILWRAAGANIVFEEYAADCELSGSSLCLHFDHSTVVKGTTIYISAGRLVVVVPTQNSVHRFSFRLREADSTLSLHGKAVLSLFPCGQNLEDAHEEHVYVTTGMVVSTDATMLPNDQTLLASQLQDGQLVVVMMPALVNRHEKAVERVLKTTSFFARLIRTEENFQVISSAVTSQGLVYALYSDYRIRIWSVESFQILRTVELLPIIAEEPVDLRLISIKVATFGARTVITVCVKQAAVTKFIFFAANCNDDLQYLATLRGSSTGEVIDFEVLDGGDGSSVVVWAIRKNAAKVGVPYNLVRCTVNFDDCMENWVEIRSVSSVEPIPNSDAPLRQKVDFVKRRVFGGEDFSFEVVLRSINMVCKGAEMKAFLTDFVALQRHVEAYLESVHFKDRYTTRKERVALSYIEKHALETATEKFWNVMLDTCEQFQAASGFLPLAIWSAPQLDLAGVIQQSRFTVSISSDEEVESLMAPYWKKDDSVTVARILRDTEKCRKSSNLTESNIIALKGTIIGNVKRLRSIAMRFADHSPFCANNGVRPPSFEYGNSPFSSGLLAASLRRYVINRLEFASILRDIINITVESASRAGAHNVGQKEREFTCRMNAIFTNYNVLAHALSARATIRSPTTSSAAMAGDAACTKQLTSVADAFFRLGGPSLLVASGASVTSSASGDEFENQRNMSVDLDILDNGDVVSNRFDRRRQSSVAVHPFSRFIVDTSFATIFYLWPESPDLMLPRFLREEKFFSALQQYCVFNDSSLDCDLKYALRFYQAIAYSGTGFGDKAVAAFKDATPGIDRPDEDDPLNKAFSTSNQRFGVSHVTRTTYFIDVLHSLEEHNHTSQLLDMGKLALTGSKREESTVQEIFTIVFRQQMNCGRFEEALRTLLTNPVAETRTVCLRDLLSKMLISKRYDVLLAMDFGYLYTTVVDFVDLRARSYDIMKDSEIFDLLATLFFKSRLYRRAAKTCYELATRLGQIPYNFDIHERRCDALLKSLTLIDLVGKKEFSWIDIVEFNSEEESDEMDVTNDEINSSMVSQSQNEKKTRVRIVTADEIKREWLLETMRQQIVDAYSMGAPSSDPEQVALKLIENKDFDNAWTLIGMFKLEPFALLESVTVECIKIDIAARKHFPAWVHSNLRYSYTAEVKDRHWHTLRSYLRDAEDDNPSDSRLKKTIVYALLTHCRPVPEWLQRSCMKHDFADFLRSHLDFGDFEEAFKLSNLFIDDFTTKLQSSSEAVEATLSVLLPVNEFDNLLDMVSEDERFSEPKQQLVNRINTLINKIITVEKSAQYVRM